MKLIEATEQAYKNGYAKGYEDGRPKWIPVTEQEEPTQNGTYLCHGYWLGSRRKQTEAARFFGEWDISNNFILTHWMPLPEPPKGE